MASITFTSGRMFCGKVRCFLDKCKFKGMDIDYLETKGFFERDFVVKGSDDDVMVVLRSLRAWANENNHSI